MPLVFLAVVVLVAIVLLSMQTGRRRRRGGPADLSGLEREYARLLHMPKKAARETLTRILHEMERDYPDRTREWRLKKMIADLRRDRQ